MKRAIEFALANIDDPSKWDSLIINKRKPHTYRAFILDGDRRICLHRFEPCKENEAFAHPHPWPNEVMILQGIYRMWVGYQFQTEVKKDSPPATVMKLQLPVGSIYKMSNPMGWHKVIPVTRCYSIMWNDKPWSEEELSKNVDGIRVQVRPPTTAGKDLEKFTDEELKIHLEKFILPLTEELEIFNQVKEEEEEAPFVREVASV